MQRIEILPMVIREMEKRRISGADLARMLQINHSSVTGMLQRPTLQVQRLVELSELFKYNFFREIAQNLPYPEPDFTSQDHIAEVAALQNRVRDLELEVSILRQTIKDLVSR